MYRVNSHFNLETSGGRVYYKRGTVLSDSEIPEAKLALLVESRLVSKVAYYQTRNIEEMIVAKVKAGEPPEDGKTAFTDDLVMEVMAGQGQKKTRRSEQEPGDKDVKTDA